MHGDEFTSGLMGLALMGFFYFLPSIVARARRLPDRMGLYLLNTVFGWSGIGWMLAMAWALFGKGPGRMLDRLARSSGSRIPGPKPGAPPHHGLGKELKQRVAEHRHDGEWKPRVAEHRHTQAASQSQAALPQSISYSRKSPRTEGSPAVERRRRW
jgi:hypothetical protein